MAEMLLARGADPIRKGFLEPEIFERLVRFLPEPINHLARFAYHTGCRKKEVRTLRWSQVDVRLWIVRLNPGTTKNDEGRIFHLVGDLRHAFESMKEIRDRDYPFMSLGVFRGRPRGQRLVRGVG
jgi:integrase